MSADPLDDLAERLAAEATSHAGTEHALGVLYQAMILVATDTDNFDAFVFALEGSIAALRADLANQIVVKGTIQ